MGKKKTNGYDEEIMTVDLFIDDETVTCIIVTILEVNDKDYIALMPLDEDGQNTSGEVWFYRYFEDEKNPNAEPQIENIDNEEEYEAVEDAFDEYLDGVEFDEFIEDEESEEN